MTDGLSETQFPVCPKCGGSTTADNRRYCFVCKRSWRKPLVCEGDVWTDLEAERNGIERRVMVTRFKWPYAYAVSSRSRRHTRIHQATLTKRFRLEHRLP